MAEAVEDRSQITWVPEVSFRVRRDASVSAEATSGKAESLCAGQ